MTGTTAAASTDWLPPSSDAPGPQEPAPRRDGARFRPLAWVVVGAGAIVPLVFTTRSSDVFYLPKLVVLWVLLVVSLWLVAFELRARRPGFRVVALVDVPIAAFFVLNLLAAAFSIDWRQSLIGEHLQYQGLLSLALYLGFFYVARVAVTTPERLTALFTCISAGAVVVSLYAIAQKLGVDPIWKGFLPAGRVFSTIGQPNALAAYLVLSIPIALSLAIQTRGLRRLACGVALAMTALALLFTYSRGGYAGAVVSVIVLGVGALLIRRAGAARPPTPRRSSVSRRSMTVAAVVAGVCVLAGLALVSPVGHDVRQSWQRAQSVSQLSGDQSISNHLDQWKVALRIVEDHPVLGTGPETFPDEFPAYSRLVLPPAHVRYFDQFRVESPHDQMLAVAAGAGIPATLAYLAVLVAVACVLVRGIRAAGSGVVRLALLAILAAMAGHVVTDSFMSAEVTGSWLMWMLMGAGVATACGPRPASTPRS